MCTGLELAAYAGAAASTVSTVNSLIKSDKTVDPAAERAKADAQASQSANARIAQRNKALAASSLLTGAPGGGGNTTFGG